MPDSSAPALPAELTELLDAYRDQCQMTGSAPDPLVWEQSSKYQAELRAALEAALRETCKDAERLDWLDRPHIGAPMLGAFTDGRLGLHRGSLVEWRWTWKGEGFNSLRDAIDRAARSPAPSER